MAPSIEFEGRNVGWFSCDTCFQVKYANEMHTDDECQWCATADTSLDLAELVRNRKQSFKRARQFASRRKM